MEEYLFIGILISNQARNIGLQQVNTKYIVFFDNDVIVTPVRRDIFARIGILDKIIQCGISLRLVKNGNLTISGQL